MEKFMLTTVDNPYNPFIQFEDWKAFDEDKGYYTIEYLSRIAKTSDELSDSDYDLAVNDAINEILYFNVLGIYQKVSKENFDEMKQKELTEEQKESLKLLQEAFNKSNIINCFVF